MSYATTPLLPEHRDSLLRLWQENLADLRAGDASAARFHWAYQSHPEGGAHTLLAVHEPQGEVVGCGSAYPRRIRVGKTEIMAGVPADFAVARAHRIGGAALGIQRGLIEGADRVFGVLIGFPNKSALPVLRRVGYRSLGTAGAWVKPLSGSYKLQEYVRFPGLARLATLPLDGYLAAGDGWRAARLPRVEGSTTQRANGAFDELWQRARDAYAVAGERSSRYLNWRYAEHTTAQYRFFEVRPRGDERLLGYVVYTLTRNKAFVIDLFALNMADAATAVLLAFCRSQREAGVASVFLGYAGNPDFAHRLRGLGFLHRPTAERHVVALARTLDPQEAQVVLDVRNWYLFEGEMDI